jgi:hypothetical protein
LYPPIGARRDGLMVAVGTSVKPTVIDECARTAEAQPERGGLPAGALSPREEVIRAPVSGTIETVIADDRMIVPIVVLIHSTMSPRRMTRLKGVKRSSSG